MNVLVDTCIWSEALRRRSQPAVTPWSNELRLLIQEGRAALIGAVRQEILSGIREQVQFEQLRDRLGAFPDIDLGREDYERAAELFNLCRRKGIQGANTDFLICAVAQRRDLAILTTDRDFEGFAGVLTLRLAQPRKTETALKPV